MKITTDEGFVGYGEVGETASEQLGPIMTDRWSHLIIGKNPLDTEKILRELWASSLFAGRGGGALLSALSGVDFALVDLKGKILGIPGYQVVGGGFRSRIRIYQDTAGGPDAATYARNALEAKQKGLLLELRMSIPSSAIVASTRYDDVETIRQGRLRWEAFGL